MELEKNNAKLLSDFRDALKFMVERNGDSAVAEFFESFAKRL